MVEIEDLSATNMENNVKSQAQSASNNQSDDANNDCDAESKLLNNKSNGSAPKNGLKTQKSVKSEQDRKMTEDINNLLRDMPLTDDMTCGFWIFKGTFFQR